MIMLLFIWVFTVCKSTPLGVSRTQRLKSTCIDGAKNEEGVLGIKYLK